MKRAFVLLFGLILSFYTNKSNAQTNSADAYAHAVVVRPITIVKVSDLNFGTFSVGSSGGTFNVSAASPAVQTISGLTQVPSGSGGISAGKFTVSGEANYSFTVSLSSTSINLTTGTGSGSANIMTINNFSTSLGSSGVGNLAGTTGTLASLDIYLGATINAVIGQNPGTYNTVTPINLTVNYN